MIVKDNISYVANGIMDFIEAMRFTHHLDEASLLTKVAALCKQRLNLIDGTDPMRNR